MNQLVVTLCDPWTNGLAPSPEVLWKKWISRRPELDQRRRIGVPGCKDLSADWSRVLTDPGIVDHRLFRVFAASAISADRPVSAESPDVAESDP